MLKDRCSGTSTPFGTMAIGTPSSRSCKLLASTSPVAIWQSACFKSRRWYSLQAIFFFNPLWLIAQGSSIPRVLTTRGMPRFSAKAARRWLCSSQIPLSCRILGCSNRSRASEAVPVRRSTGELAGTSGVFAADWSEAHRPTSAPASAKPMANLETENAGPP